MINVPCDARVEEIRKSNKGFSWVSERPGPEIPIHSINMSVTMIDELLAKIDQQVKRIACAEEILLKLTTGAKGMVELQEALIEASEFLEDGDAST